MISIIVPHADCLPVIPRWRFCGLPGIAWKSSTASFKLRLLEHEVRLGYWSHREFQWTNAVRRACAISAEHSLSMVMRGMDVFHVAIAQELKADVFLSFDNDQTALATVVGLKVLAL